jgi:hypothetical protein
METGNYIHNEQMTSKLQSFYENETMCDVALKSENYTINAHRIVLATCSEYFHAMFSGNWTESSGRDVAFNGLTSVGLRAIVEFAYYGKISPDLQNISDIISALNQCMVIEAIKLCEGYIIEKLDKSNFVQFFKLSETFQLKNVQHCVVDFVINEFLPSSVTSEEESEINTCIFQLEPQLFNLALKEWDYSQIGWGEFAAIDLVLQWARSDLNAREEHITRLLSSMLKREIDKSTVNELLVYSQEGKYSVKLDTCIVVGLANLPVFNTVDKNWCQLPEIIDREYELFFEMALLDNSLYVCGGWDVNGTALNACYKYVPYQNRWFLIKPMLKPRGCFSLVSLSHKLFALGGIPAEQEPDKCVEIYDPSADFWCDGVPLPEPLACHAASQHDGKIYVSGGFKELEGNSSDELMCYDLEKGQWSYKKRMLKGRMSHEMVVHKDCLYVFGGQDGADELHASQVDPLVEYYDVLTDNWTILGIFEHQDTMSLHGACFVGEYIYIMFEDCMLAQQGSPCPDGKDWKLFMATYQPDVGDTIIVCEGDWKIWVSGTLSRMCALQIPSIMRRYMSCIQ